MRAHIIELVSQALGYLKRDGELDIDPAMDVLVEQTRDPSHGDYACNIALVLAKPLGRNPREIAEIIQARLPQSKRVAKVEIAGPGFLNFFASQHYLRVILREILAQGERYGEQEPGSLPDILAEYVSANPTGPLHVGHGRGAAYGASLSAILKAAGHRVHREYYVNDHGRQMDILAVSVWLRYLELAGERVAFPSNGYRGDYIYDIAREVRSRHGDALRHTGHQVADGLPADGENGDPEKHIDALIKRAHELLGESGYEACFNAALETMVEDIRDDLDEFGVVFERWYSERALETSGARWSGPFKGSTRPAGCMKKTAPSGSRPRSWAMTRTALSCARTGGPPISPRIWPICSTSSNAVRAPRSISSGADHHGYVPRLKAAARGLGEDPDRLEFQLVQFAILFRGGKKVQMSTRSGSFVTLRELREEVGTDAARYFYVMRSHEQHLDFDLDLAKSRANDNPVYYIQYAHARIHSVFRQLEGRGQRHNQAIGEAAISRLDNDHEQALMRTLGRYPEVIEGAARRRCPHVLAHYLHDVASEFHAWYNNSIFLVEDDDDLRNARLNLVAATGQVLRNGLALIGVTAPEEM